MKRKIEAWDCGLGTPDKFLIRIGADRWAMSADADAPNGACIFLGRESKVAPESVAVKLACLPDGIKRKIRAILKASGERWTVRHYWEWRGARP